MRHTLAMQPRYEMYGAKAKELDRQTKLILACLFSGGYTVFRAEHKCHYSHAVYPLECAAHTTFLPHPHLGRTAQVHVHQRKHSFMLTAVRSLLMAYGCWVIAARHSKLVVTSSKSPNNETKSAVNAISNVHVGDAPTKMA